MHINFVIIFKIFTNYDLSKYTAFTTTAFLGWHHHFMVFIYDRFLLNWYRRYLFCCKLARLQRCWIANGFLDLCCHWYFFFWIQKASGKTTYAKPIVIYSFHVRLHRLTWIIIFRVSIFFGYVQLVVLFKFFLVVVQNVLG